MRKHLQSRYEGEIRSLCDELSAGKQVIASLENGREEYQDTLERRYKAAAETIKR
jgi:hypothetical protein